MQVDLTHPVVKRKSGQIGPLSTSVSPRNRGFPRWHPGCYCQSKPSDVKRSANKARRSLAEEVLEYLLNHPKAQDTIEGIVMWWLPTQQIPTAIDQIETALQELVAKKLV